MTVNEALALAKCIDCLERGTKETLMALGGLQAAELASGQVSEVTQVQKAVTVGGIVLLAAPASGDTRKFITIQNVGDAAVCVRAAASPSATAANGEWVLAGGDTDLDGKGGFLTLDGYSGGLWAISTSGTQNVSVAYADV